MNQRLIILFLFGLFITSCKETSKQPNIILIMTDDQGWLDAGFNGNTDLRTPHLDSLAAKGVIFNRFYSASAVCSPTRASLITGRNPLRMNIPYANSGHMIPAEITIPELLKAEAYLTGHFGKWHLGTLTQTELDANRGGREKFLANYSIPSQHGYDISFCTESKVPTFDPMLYPNTFQAGESMRYGWRAISNPDSSKAYGTAYWTGPQQRVQENLKGDNSRVIMDRVIAFIDSAQQSKQAFFSTIWLHTPHLPVVSDSLHRSYYSHLALDKQIYYGTITAMDEQIGRLWQKLKEVGIQEETIIFFCSDNGPERGTPGSAGIFRERKRSLYEGGVRVPAFMIWQGKVAGGRRIDFPAVTSDYLPTLLDILHLEYPSERPIDGESIWDVLQGEERGRTNPIGFICQPKVSWVTDQYKLIGNESLESFELYDLIKDPSEQENQIDSLVEIAQEMKRDLFAWLSSVENSQAGGDY